MLSLRVLTRNQYRRATWKNGLGYTDEIAIYPEGADLRRGDFLYRLSSAQIAQASPFSAFPEHDRTLVVLTGQGLRLSHDYSGDGEEDSTELPPLEPYEFPGDIQSRCELLGGPVTDFSLFIRKGEAEGLTSVEEVNAEEGSEWIPEGRWNFLYAVNSPLEVLAPHAEDSVSVGTGDTLLVELDSPLSEENPLRIFSGAPHARMILVSIQA